MSSIRDIPGVNHQLKKLEKESEVRKANAAKKYEQASSASASQEARKDSVEISSAGRDLMAQKAQTENLVSVVKDAGTLSADERLAIREKIASDYYGNPEVVDKIVDDVVDSYQNFSSEIGKAEEPVRVTESTISDYLGEIQSKIQTGEYNRENVIDLIVERMYSAGIF
jgi:hypothetical protein